MLFQHGLSTRVPVQTTRTHRPSRRPVFTGDKKKPAYTREHGQCVQTVVRLTVGPNVLLLGCVVCSVTVRLSWRDCCAPLIWRGVTSQDHFFTQTVSTKLTDWVKILLPTRHRTDHFGDVLSCQYVG